MYPPVTSVKALDEEEAEQDVWSFLSSAEIAYIGQHGEAGTTAIIKQSLHLRDLTGEGFGGELWSSN